MDRTFHFTATLPGVRLDKFISEFCPELSRTQAQRLIAEGFVKVNNRLAVKPGLKLEAGSEVEVNVPLPSPSPLPPQSLPLKILYEDNDLLVVDKPAGLTVHPAPGHESGTLINAILAHYPHLADMGDTSRPGVVHRLDKDTSGVMLVAKNTAAYLNLTQQFKDRTVKKSYLTLVKGRLTPLKGVIEADIGRHPVDRKKMTVVKSGREARTAYSVIKYLGDYALLEVLPQTGRTHQIRVHLAAIGYPVVGDATYGVKSPFLLRQFLHASKLGFNLPSTGQWVEFESGLPEDLQRALEELSRNPESG